jgi:hypothetical protein
MPKPATVEPSPRTMSVSPSSMTMATLPSQSSSVSYGWELEEGQKYGNVVVRNHCNNTVYLASVGGWILHGYRDDKTGYGTKEDEIKHPILSGGDHTETYRITCPITVNTTKGYCWSHDKLAGQGVSMKISNDNTTNDILQVEYALVKNPMRGPDGDTIHRLHYDISLLDCARPEMYVDVYKANNATDPRNVTEINDVQATVADHMIKAQKCPGYQQGIAVTFSNDTKGAICEPIKCDGVNKCKGIYLFDRTRKDEPSKECAQEYRGNMVVDLCAGNKGDGKGGMS